MIGVFNGRRFLESWSSLYSRTRLRTYSQRESLTIGLSPIFSSVSVENTAVFATALDGVALDGVALDSSVSDNTAASSSPLITRTALDGDATFRDG